MGRRANLLGPFSVDRRAVRGEGRPMSRVETGEPQAVIPEPPAAILSRQREAFLRDGPPGLSQRLEDLEALRRAIRQNAQDIAEAIFADFGNRSRHESMLADVWPVLAAIRHTRNHLGQWMKPKRVSVGLELKPGRARILSQPVGV